MIIEKDLLTALETLDEGNPYATFLDQSTLSTVDDEGWIDTGSYILNGIISGKLKKGGIPDGRVTYFFGESMVGKSLFVLKILANAQKKGKVAVIFDTENAIDKQSADRIGLDASKVKYVPIFNIEQARNSLYKFLTYVKEHKLEGKFIVAIDSIGNLESQMEQTRMEKESMSMDMGTRARAIKSLMRTATQLSALTKTPIIISGHVYDNPGELHPSLVKTSPGGKSVLYMPSVSVQMMRKATKEDVVKSDDSKLVALQRNYTGAIIRTLTVKNRFIKQYLEGEVYISFATGVDKYYGLLDLAVALGIIIQGGATYTFNGTKLGYAKNFHRNFKFWDDTIIPLIEEKIKIEWAYSSVDNIVPEMGDDIIDTDKENVCEYPSTGAILLHDD